MKANELRIGNWVRLREHDAFIQIEQYQLCESELINLQPIPLTEEWLLNFCFASNPYQDRYEKGVLHIECDKTKGYLQLWCEQLPQAIFIKYVHQLQNLYFALKGQELTYVGNNHLCCTPEGQIKRYVNCIGCDRKPLIQGGNK